MMARYDSGADNLLTSLANRLPGKEIWITEWNPRAGAATAMDAPDPASPAMQMHAAARLIFTLLRHPEVTLAEYFMLNFDNAKAYTVFVKVDGSYHPIPVAQALAWFDNAANGGATFREYTWGSRIPGGGVLANESYFPAVAGLFTARNGRTLLIQNATASQLSVNLSAFGPGLPRRIEVMAPPLEDPEKAAAQIQTAPPASVVQLAPYSLTRVTWDR
jgi:hypothetical protein